MGLAREKYVAFQQQRNATPVQVNPQKTALCIIEMQEYFRTPDSPLLRLSQDIVPGVLDYFQGRGPAVVELTLRRLLAFY